MTEEKSLYDRLGGIYAMTLVVNRFSDQVVENHKVGKGSPNVQLSEWSTDKLDRLTSLKWQRHFTRSLKR